MDCTDCRNCGKFALLRIVCLHPELPANEVDKNEPIGGKEAKNCRGFDISAYPHTHSEAQLEQAIAQFGDSEDGLRQYLLEVANEFQMIVEKQPEGFRGNPQVYHWSGSGWYAPIQLNGETHFYHIGDDPDVKPDERGYGTPGWVEDPPEVE